jgi:YceI-like domain
MRVNAGCKLRAPGAALLALLLCGCPLPPRAPAPAGVGVPTPTEKPAPHEGTPYPIVAAESLLLIRVYRGGALASAGHNHVIASHSLRGTVYVPDNLMRASFEVHVPVAELTVDEPALRERERSADFPPEVPESARQGTRRNMLGEALLDGEHNQEIVLRALRIEPETAAGGTDGAGGAGAVLARVETTVRGEVRAITVQVSYTLADGALTASGEARLRQSDLGLTPFSAMLGALQVQDEMRVSFRIVARASRPLASYFAPSSPSSSFALYTLRSASNMMAGSTATARLSSGSYQ